MKTVKQLLSIIISYSLVVLPLNAADIQIDGSTQTTLDTAQNGVPVVNIANPNSSGLSHNRFTNYNVTNQGVILNNSVDTTVNTQLGGYIFGNKNLTSNAKVILNEVTSTNRTTLGGYTEVAGKKADLVIANPNGITINGAGFINTANVTLTTGSPLINNGQLSSFNIQGGDISIQGDGLDVSEQDSAHLYSYYLTLNAAIHAKNLDIKLGQNNIDYTTKEITSHTDIGTATLLLDSSALGGMYADRIVLVGTDKGIGVNLPPEVLASNGDISITNDGTIELQKLTAKENVNVNANDSDININDTISSGTDIDLQAKNITNNALINASNDLTATSTNLINNKTIFSGNDMNLYTGSTLSNNENANILAVNNLTMSADNSNAKSQTIENKSATIQTLNGNIDLYANEFHNIPTVVPTKSSYVDSVVYRTRYLSGDWRTHETITTTIESLDKTGYIPSSLMSGGNLNIDAATHNQYSLISASGDINFLGSLTNDANLEAYNILYTHGYVQHCDSNSWPKSGCSWYHKYDTNTYVNTLLDNADSTIQAGGSITANVNDLTNGSVNSNQAITSQTVLDTSTGTVNYTNPDNTTSTITIPTDDQGLFVTTTVPNSNYLIETNPAFTIYNNFISSDYLLSHIDYDAESTTKRLGDAFYENTLIRNSIFEQTGQRFLNSDIKNDNDQYKYLMDNAIKASSDLKLTPGIALSKEQINALTDDIVWMEAKVVQGQKVLVPVVYIANPNNFRLEGARILAANDIDLKVANLKNAGTINAGADLTVNASDSISNYGGELTAAKNIDLQATNDIKNTSGTIKADNVNLNSVNGSITNERYAKAVTTLSSGSREDKTLIGRSGEITAANDLNIKANKDVTVAGSGMSAKSLNIDADNINITTTEDKRDFFGGGTSAYVKENSLTNLASNLNADNININSKGTTTLKGSNLTAKDDINVNADKLNVLAVNNSDYREMHASNKGFMSSSSSLDAALHENVLGTTIKANNISLNTQGDINLESVNINADNSAVMNSKNGNVNLSAKSYTNAELHERSSSSFGGLIGSHSIDSLSQTKLGDSTTTANNNIVVGGKNINIVANDLIAQNGDVKLTAGENINITSGTEEKSEQHLKESTGLSFGLSGSKLTYAQTIKDSNQNTSLTNKASNIKANNLTLQSGQDTNLIASNIDATSMAVNTARDFNVLSDKNINTKNQEHSKKDIGLELTLNSKEASIFTGYWEDDHGKTTTSNNIAKSNINVGTLDVNSKNTNIVGSDISANDITINAENTRVLSDTANTNIDTYTKSIKAGISAGISQNLSNAVDAVKDQGKAKSNTAIASRALKTYDAVTNFLTKPVEAGVSAIYEQTTTNTNDNFDEVVSSNLYATNSISLNSNDNLEVAGSNIYSGNLLDINAKNIDLHSSSQNYSQTTSSSSQNAKLGLYGTNMGDLTLGFQDSDQNMNGTSEVNSHLYAANKATLTSQENTTLKGATVDANDLEVNVGQDLVMQSLQDTQNIKGSSKGGSISGNLATMTPSGISANTGTTKGDRKWVNEVTSLNGENSITVAVNDKTSLTGASITNVDKNGNDQANLKLSTKTLETQNIKDSDTYDSTTIGIGIGSTGSKPKLNTIDYTNNTKDKEQIVRATVGKGEIVTDSDTASLNRDTSKIKEITKDESSNIELYASDNSVNALMDPVKAYNDTKQKAQDVGLAAHKEVLENLPSASKGKDGKYDFIDNTIGAVLDTLGTYTLGAIPNAENDGGYISQIATQLFGDNRTGIIVKDKETLLKAGVSENDIQKVTLVKTKDGVKKIEDLKQGDVEQDRVTVYRTNPNKTVIIGNPEDKTGNPALEDYKIRLSEEDIKNSGISHLFTNGMFNSTETATYNQQTQQGSADGILNYNQQHGIIGDLLESAQDAVAVNSNLSLLGTGGARQTGYLIDQTATIRQGDLTLGAHSQGTLMSQVGMEQNKEHLKELVQGNTKSKFLVQYSGSPVNHNIAEKLVTDIYGGERLLNARTNNKGIDSVFRSHVTPQDAVGSVLGYQSAGINNSNNLGSNMLESLIALPRLFGFGDTSPHSYYPCVIGCGNENYTPDIKNYYTPDAKDGLKEHPRNEYYQNNFTNKNGQMTIDMNLLPQVNKPNTAQTILDITKGQ